MLSADLAAKRLSRKIMLRVDMYITFVEMSIDVDSKLLRFVYTLFDVIIDHDDLQCTTE